jgi:hypothetical protein
MAGLRECLNKRKHRNEEDQYHIVLACTLSREVLALVKGVRPMIVCSPSLDYFTINRYYGKNDLTINAVNACEQRMSRIQEKFIVKFTKFWT